MDEFRKLASLLGPIARASWVEPVKELQDYVDKTSFLLNLGQPSLVIEDERLEPVGKFKVYHNVPNEGSPPTVEYDLGRAEKTGKVRRYSLTAGSGSPVLRYEPGQALYAVQEVKNDGSSGWALGWTNGRSQRYRFENLNQPPQLYKAADGPTSGAATRDVLLSFNPSLERLPELMP
jgi:hypothetical protein